MASLMSILFSAGNCCKIAGWGATDRNLKFALELQEVGVPIADFENCAKIYKESWSDQIVTEENFCAGIGGRDACMVGLFLAPSLRLLITK